MALVRRRSALWLYLKHIAYIKQRWFHDAPYCQSRGRSRQSIGKVVLGE